MSDPDKTARAELTAEKAKVNALQSKIKVLIGQLDELRKEASVMYEAEGTITDLQRKRELAESHYKYFSESLENSRIDERLGSGRIPNISRIQEPSPAFKVQTKIYKLMAAIFFGGIGLAISLAFVIELVLDQSLKRPMEVEQALGLPLFISIPQVSLNRTTRGIGSGRKLSLLNDRAGEATHNNGKPSNRDTELDPWDPNHILQPFYEALRDRLITYFEITNLVHKPKLVAITSCNEGSGVSTVAAGLAASLSETGDGNVLLVDMNQQNGAAHQFCNGELACGLDDALEKEKRDLALVQENLYVVTESKNGERLPTALPKRFKNLVPRLKASDYDYIIFDMPPVTQISVTPRLARFMDMVFMVVEPERTNRQVLKRATSMLAESKTNMGVILNKGHDYMPKPLRQEL
jgi:Mrp family chromosome partitioning ATPase